MAGAIVKHPLRLGAIVLLLVALLTTLLIIQISLSHSPGDFVSSDQGGVIAEEGAVAGEGRVATSSGMGGGQTPVNAAQDLDNTGVGTGFAPVFIIGHFQINDTGPVIVGNPATATGTISGFVSAEELIPLKGIIVYLTDRNGEPTGAVRQTDAGGKFSFTGLKPGEYKLYFSDPSGVYEPGWYGGIYGSLVRVEAGQESMIAHSMVHASRVKGRIAGRVTDLTGKGVKGVEVLAYAVKEPEYPLEERGVAKTDENGYYTIADLPPLYSSFDSSQVGYKVFFDPLNCAYAHQWYRGQPTYLTAELIPLHPGETVGKVNAQLNGGGTISGRITIDGKPASGAKVEIFNETGIIVSSPLAGDQGEYGSCALPPGRYKVRAMFPVFNDNNWYWFNHKQSFIEADWVDVLEGRDSNGIDIDFSLPPPEAVPLPHLTTLIASGRESAAKNEYLEPNRPYEYRPYETKLLGHNGSPSSGRCLSSQGQNGYCSHEQQEDLAGKRGKN
jgi:hypothetical protein